jgi:hypothetical protein
MAVGTRGTAPSNHHRVAAVRRRAGRALTAVLVAHMAVAFFPYRFDPPHPTGNGATVKGGVVTIDGDAVARTTRPPAWLPAAKRSGEFWMSLSVRSLDDDQPGPVRVVAIEGGYVQADVMVGQHHDDMTVSVRRPDGDTAGNPPVYLEGVFADHDWHDVEVAGHPHEVVVVVDGGPPATHPMPEPGAYQAWDTGYRLHVGDSPTGNRPWHGQVRRLQAGSGGISEDYLAPGVLEVPDRIWYVPERVDDPLGWRSDKHRAWPLAAVHLVAFLPVGALLAAAAWPGRRRDGPGRPARRHLAAGLGVVGLAALLQLGKVFFDARHPAIVDLVAMSAGGLLGYALWLARATPHTTAGPDRPSEAPPADKAGAVRDS